ncbi:transposase [Acinetobacter baumannii]|nr:transposase [Acinetobacter baumannii]
MPEGEGIDWNVVIVDATEIPIQRPKNQKKSYSGKKEGSHTFKVKAIIHYKTQKILSLCTSRGAVHDFELFKRNLNQIHVGVFILADKGYQRIYTVYPNSLLPLKAKSIVSYIPN